MNPLPRYARNLCKRALGGASLAKRGGSRLATALNREAKNDFAEPWRPRAPLRGARPREVRSKTRPSDNRPTSPSRAVAVARVRVPPRHASPWGAKTWAGAGPIRGAGRNAPAMRGGAGRDENVCVKLRSSFIISFLCFSTSFFLFSSVFSLVFFFRFLLFFFLFSFFFFFPQYCCPSLPSCGRGDERVNDAEKCTMSERSEIGKPF